MSNEVKAVTSGAPDAEASWLELVMAALQQLRPYRTDPSGEIKLNRAIAKFQWDGINHEFYANLSDQQVSFGLVVSGVISGINPHAQSIEEAADYIDTRFNHFVSQRRSREEAAAKRRFQEGESQG